MRITTGRFKGRNIATVADGSVRPATDRVRQSLFNILVHRMDLAGSSVLDLFAGSGSLGFEALSRGAAHVTFVENNHRVARMLAETAATLGCSGAVTILQTDALDAVNHVGGPFTLVFADPPYNWQGTGGLPDLVFSRGLVAPGGLLLIEHTRDTLFPESPLFRSEGQRTYGRTIVTLFTGAAEATPL